MSRACFVGRSLKCKMSWFKLVLCNGSCEFCALLLEYVIFFISRTRAKTWRGACEGLLNRIYGVFYYSSAISSEKGHWNKLLWGATWAVRFICTVEQENCLLTQCFFLIGNELSVGKQPKICIYISINFGVVDLLKNVWYTE